MSTWLDTSERGTGLVIKRRIPLIAVRPDLFCPPYNKVIADMQSNKYSPEELYLMHTQAYDTACLAAENINGSHNDLDWVDLLKKSKIIHETGQKLGRVAFKMQDGDWDGNVGTFREVINQLGDNRSGRMLLSDIEPSDIPFIETGWEAYDTELGGIPSVGLVIISGNPGVGKTSWVIKLVKSFVTKHRYENKQVGFYSLEMIKPEIAMRFKEVGGKGKYTTRIQINCDPMTVDEIINDASQIEDLGLIVIDFADLMIRGETTDASMGEIYTKCAIGAKQLNCPVILLSQYSRRYEGGIPRPYFIRYTSLAEILGWMIICLWNPHRSFYEKDAEALASFPLRTDEAAAFVWKIRGGFRQHPMDSPGAIIHQFSGKAGWSNFGRWQQVKHYKKI